MQAVHTCGMRIHTGTYHSCPYGNSMKFKLSRSSKASPRGLPWWICASSWPRLKNWVEPRQKHVLEPLKLVFLSHFFCWHFRVCALLYLAEAACDTCTHLVCLHLPFSHKMLLASSCETWEYWSTSFRMFQLSICHEAIWHKQQAMLFEPKSCQKHHILASMDSFAEPGHTFLCKVTWWAWNWRLVSWGTAKRNGLAGKGPWSKPRGYRKAFSRWTIGPSSFFELSLQPTPFLMSGHLCPVRCRWRWLFVEAGGHPIFPRHAVRFGSLCFFENPLRGSFKNAETVDSQVNLSSRRRRPA